MNNSAKDDVKFITPSLLKFWENTLKDLSLDEVKNLDFKKQFSQVSLYDKYVNLFVLDPTDKSGKIKKLEMLLSKNEIQKMRNTIKSLSKNDLFNTLMNAKEIQKCAPISIDLPNGFRVLCSPTFLCSRDSVKKKKDFVVSLKVISSLPQFKKNLEESWARRDIEIGLTAYLYEKKFKRPLKDFVYLLCVLNSEEQYIITIKSDGSLNDKIEVYKKRASDLIDDYIEWKKDIKF